MVVCRIGAGLFGYTEIIYRDKHLYIAHQLNYCEKPEGYKNCRLTAFLLGYNSSANAFAYAVGNTAYVFIAISDFADMCRKRNGVNRLNHAFRTVV